MSATLIDGGMVHYESFGRGRPAILVHGWIGSWRYWAATMDELSSDHRAYALDLWGYGDSDKRLPRCSVEHYTQLLLSTMDYLAIERASLVGHALGGVVATRLAAEHPDRVDRVMAVSLPLSADGISRKLLAAGPNSVLERVFWARQSPYTEVEVEMQKAAENVVALTIQSVARLELRPVLDRIDVPTLTVYGGKDSVIDPTQADYFENGDLAARAIVLDQARHFPMLDEATKFNRLLRDFLTVSNEEELNSLAIKKEWRRRWR